MHMHRCSLWDKHQALSAELFADTRANSSCSNHGGRQCDCAPSAVEMLPHVVRAIGHRLPLIVDGGIRRGTDVLKVRLSGNQRASERRAAQPVFRFGHTSYGTLWWGERVLRSHGGRGSAADPPVRSLDGL